MRYIVAIVGIINITLALLVLHSELERGYFVDYLSSVSLLVIGIILIVLSFFMV